MKFEIWTYKSLALEKFMKIVVMPRLDLQK